MYTNKIYKLERDTIFIISVPDIKDLDREMAMIYVCMRVYVYAYVCACPFLCIDKVASQRYECNIMTSSNGNIFRVGAPL